MIVKPEASCQGKGIYLVRDMASIEDEACVVQVYIEKPFLYKTRKFDIRIWAAVTDDFRIFVHKHGYLRTSSNEYDLKTDNSNIHLTNQCLQVKSDTSGSHEAGNTLMFEIRLFYLYFVQAVNLRLAFLLISPFTYICQPQKFLQVNLTKIIWFSLWIST